MQWEPRTGMILLASAGFVTRASVSSVEGVLLQCSFKTTLAHGCLTILVGCGWYYGVWKTKQPLLEVTELYSYGVPGYANPTFTTASLWKP